MTSKMAGRLPTQVEALEAYLFATADLIEYAKAYVDASMVDRLTALADDAREALKLAKGENL